MDFHQLMHMAASKQENASKNKVNWYNRDLPAPKKEEKPKPRSEIVQKLMQEKEREKQEKQKALQAEMERKEKEEQKKNQFRIPKKKSEPTSMDTESFINSLFDDSGVMSDASEKSDSKSSQIIESGCEKNTSHSTSSLTSSSKNKDSSSSSRNIKHDTVDKHRDKTSSHYHHHHRHHHKSSSSHGSHKHSESKISSSSSLSKEPGRSSSNSDSHKHKSGSKTDRHNKSTTDHSHTDNSASKNSGKHSNSSLGDGKHKTSSSHSSKIQPSSSKLSSSSVKNHQSASEKCASPPSSLAAPRKPADEQPIVLNKHHLNPIVERHAAPGGMSEKEKILARLQAIKQRTLEAIQKTTKAKRSRGGEKSQRKSKTDEKHDDKTKSVEIVHDAASSSDEEKEEYNLVPEALDVMISERNAKLEKEKIARMAKQAWERAMKKDQGVSDKEIKVKKHRKSSHKSTDISHKLSKSNREHKTNDMRKDHSLSPNPDSKKVSIKPKKPLIVRRSGQGAPPPMDFKALLEMAEKKQKEPPKPLPVFAKKKKKEEEERPLTQEEKERLERKKSKEYQDWLKHGGKPPSQKKDISDDEEERLTKLSSNKNNHKDRNSFPHYSIPLEKNKALSGSIKQSFNKPHTGKDPLVHKIQADRGNSHNKHKNITANENVLVCGPGPASSSEDEGSPRHPQSSNPFDRIISQVHKKRPISHQSDSANFSKKRRIQDSEEEDSDMDSFIDDGEDGEADISNEIKKLFGYDRNKYKDERDDDLSDMEANFSTIMQEEKQSAKIGLKEDLEDIRREQEELRRKALLKKQTKKK